MKWLCEVVELKEELEDEVVARISVRERARRWEGRCKDAACSESEDREESDLGGEASSCETEIRSYGFRVRRGGVMSSSLVDPGSVLFGRVRSQPSQGRALLRSKSSQVFL